MVYLDRFLVAAQKHAWIGGIVAVGLSLVAPGDAACSEMASVHHQRGLRRKEHDPVLMHAAAGRVRVDRPGDVGLTRSARLKSSVARSEGAPLLACVCGVVKPAAWSSAWCRVAAYTYA